MANNESETRKKPGRSLGRTIATVIVASGIVYLLGVGLVSVIPQIFTPARADLPQELSCQDGLDELRAELLDRAGERVSAGGSDTRDLRAWLDDWDARYHGLEPRCEGNQYQRWTLVGRLRRRIEGTLERFDREDGALARATKRASST